MSKNSRRIIHNTTVYDKEYHWSAVDYKDDGTCVVKIWRYYDKIYEDSYHSTNVNPRTIRAKIREIMKLF